MRPSLELTKTDRQVKAYLDDLAALAVKHGIIVVAQHSFRLVDRPDCFGGYVADPRGNSMSFVRGHQPRDPDLRVSLDVGGLSNHERLRLIGSLS